MPFTSTIKHTSIAPIFMPDDALVDYERMVIFFWSMSVAAFGCMLRATVSDSLTSEARWVSGMQICIDRPFL